MLDAKAHMRRYVPQQPIAVAVREYVICMGLRASRSVMRDFHAIWMWMDADMVYFGRLFRICFQEFG